MKSSQTGLCLVGEFGTDQEDQKPNSSTASSSLQGTPEKHGARLLRKVLLSQGLEEESASTFLQSVHLDQKSKELEDMQLALFP